MTDRCPCTECAALAQRASGPPGHAHDLAQIRAHQSEKHRALVALLLEARVWLRSLSARDRRDWQRYAPGFIPATEKVLATHQLLLPDDS